MGGTHGLAATYRSRRYKCRCQACTEAHRERHINERVHRAARLTADPTLAPHGSASTYNNWGCRCAPCSQAHSERCAEYKRQRRATSHGES